MKTVLVDTNAYGALLGGDRKVLAAIGAAETVILSFFVLGELYAGFRGGTKFHENVDRLARFLEKPRVKLRLPSTDTAEIYGQIKDDLKRKGTPIPINDVWIAAHTIEYGAILVSYDTHFRTVPGLRVWDAPASECD